MKIPNADSNPGVSLHYYTSLPTELQSCMDNSHSYKVYSFAIGLLIGFDSDMREERNILYEINKKIYNSIFIID